MSQELHQAINQALSLQQQALQAYTPSSATPQLSALVECFHTLCDQFSTADYPGYADALALYCELLEQIDGLGEEGLCGLLGSAASLLSALFNSADQDRCARFLELLADPRWPEPIPAKDLAFLQELLQEDCHRLTQSIDEQNETPVAPPAASSRPATAQAQAAVPSRPVFCPVDLSLLRGAGPVIDPQVLQMLSTSARRLVEQWQECSRIEQFPNGLEQCHDSLTPVARALETLHLLGARNIIIGLQHNLHYVRQQPQLMTDELRQALALCFSALAEHFADVTQQPARQALIDSLDSDCLPCRPDAEQSAFLSGLLALASVKAPASIERERATEADTRLETARDIDPQLLEMLYGELPQHSDNLSVQLDAVINGRDTAALRHAQRNAHTIKGLANMAGISGLANLTHRLEDILEALAATSALPDGRLADDLQEAADCLAAMTDALTAGQAAPANSVSVLQTIMDWHFRLRSEGAQAVTRDPSMASTASASQTPAAPTDARNEVPPAAADQDQAAESSSIRVAGDTLDNLLRIAGETSTLNTQLDEEINRLRGLTRISRERHRAMQRVMSDLEQQLSEYYTLDPRLDTDSGDFDPLEMDRYNEMHTTLSMLHEVAEDIRDVQQTMDNHIRHLNELHLAQSGLQRETLDSVLDTRLVAVKSIVPRMQRIMRQACRAAGKKAELEVVGEETRIDSQILDQLADPLMHIIRNAIDHGLERPEQRQQAGKPLQGRLRLSFHQADNLIQVICEDDGAGLDLQRIREVAQSRRLIQPGVELSQRELQRLILLPGFSTRTEISQLSGRGIGMDVVYQRIVRLQGSLSIYSQAGQNTRFELSLPSSSLMIRALLVRVEQQTVALASHGIEKSLLSIDGQMVDLGRDGLRFDIDGESFPAYTLEQLTGEKAYDYGGKPVYPVLLINLAQGEKAAVLVREIIAHRELVFKEMGPYVPDIPGIPGVTILANGEAAPVVSLPTRISHLRSGAIAMNHALEPIGSLELPKLLVVDDSLSARKSLALLLRDAGYQVRTAIDGLDALNQLRKDPPDLVLTDFEMPRMSGTELSSVIRGRPELAHIPVIMISSRSAAKHRQEADQAGVSAYLTKPWTESALLDQVQQLLEPEAIAN